MSKYITKNFNWADICMMFCLFSRNLVFSKHVLHLYINSDILMRMILLVRAAAHYMIIFWFPDVEGRAQMRLIQAAIP